MYFPLERGRSFLKSLVLGLLLLCLLSFLAVSVSVVGSNVLVNGLSDVCMKLLSMIAIVSLPLLIMMIIFLMVDLCV